MISTREEKDKITSSSGSIDSCFRLIVILVQITFQINIYNSWFIFTLILLFINNAHFSQFSSVAQSCDSLRPHGLQHARLPCPSSIPGVYSNSCPSHWWYHSTISSSVIPFSSHLQSFSSLGSFQMSRFFASNGQTIRVSASASVLPMNIHNWFPLGLTGLISLQSKGLSRAFSSYTTAQKHKFFSAQLSL